jgi:hypothetical protein
MTEPRPWPDRMNVLRRPRDEQEVRRRQHLAAKWLFTAGLVAGLLSPRIGTPSLLAAGLLVGTAVVVWRWPGTASSSAGFALSVVWFMWAVWWHLNNIVAVGPAPRIDAVAFLTNLAPGLFAGLSALYCASSLVRRRSAARHAA